LKQNEEFQKKYEQLKKEYDSRERLLEYEKNKLVKLAEDQVIENTEHIEEQMRKKIV